MRRGPVALLCICALGAAAWFGFLRPDDAGLAAAAPPAEQVEASTELVSVRRGDLTESRRVTGTVGFGAITTLPVVAEGIVTWAPLAGTVLEPGDTVVRVGERPVVMVAGSSPLHRELRLVPRWERDAAGVLLGLQTGLDVAQLQRFLVSHGFDDAGRLAEDATFGPSTERAVKAWQTSVGHTATGRVDRSQMLFVDGPRRVETATAVGQPFAAVTVTSTDTILTARTDTTARAFFPVGAEVEVEGTDGPLVGTVTKSLRSVDSDRNQVIQVIEVTVTGVSLDQLGDAAELTGTIVQASDVLTVPVRALLALTEGGWALEVPEGPGTGLVGVELLTVIDTSAVITGVEEGLEVVVPL